MRDKRDKGFCDKRDRDDGQEMREKRDKRWDEGKRVLVIEHYR